MKPSSAAERDMTAPTANVPLVSFIIPTLNRGRFVVRAVASCLRAQACTQNVAVEVIVIDSQSDDGSWELLLEHYGQDPRVRLVQNQRGLGPARSWLDGVSLAQGEFVTFVWSDDFISPRFLSTLLPLLEDGAQLAVGAGVVRDLDNECDLPADPSRTDLESEAFMIGYFPGLARDGVQRSVSPVCAVYTRPCFDRWAEVLEDWCTSSPLRRKIMWERAIGPDLLLYLIAANMSSMVPTVRECVAQFSSHKGSITVSSSAWLLRAGYWLARLWVLESGAAELPVTRKGFAKMAASSLVEGLMLALTAPDNLTWLGNSARLRRAVLAEAAKILRTVRARAAISAVVLATVEVGARGLASRLKYFSNR